MATINFIVKGKKGYSNILIRFKNGRKFDYSASTELKVLPNHWSKAKQKVKNISDAIYKDEVNDHLFELEKFIIKEFNKDNSTGVFIDREWLKTKIANHFNRPTDELSLDKVYFLPFIERFIELAPSRIIKGKNKPVSKGTITKYNTTKNKLIEYQERFKTRLKFTDLNLTFYDKFVNYLNQEQNINLGTIGNYIGTIKTIARDAKLQGLPVHEHINHPKFFAPKVKADSIYLKDSEINIIYNHDYKGVERLENARDLFIIGLRTGLRISDFLRLKETNIKEGFIEIETKKTNQNVIIPMHPQVKAILEKHNGFPRKISDQKFNLHIKEVCKVAGFTQMVEGSLINSKTKRKEKGVFPKYKLVSSHICRRSFASNLYGEIPNMTIMAITGHQTEAQFLKYIKITPKENAKKLQEYWLKQKEENNFEKLNMKVAK
ncbi:phage integrase SAM-like domain-containing protein [Mesoflavibacter profundi]|uniref:phage integrase SAM-like domain-containing protein n=1 Tax=Mesoflavibacter profundi TaxID=2708110 RepID=UPI003512BB2F